MPNSQSKQERRKKERQLDLLRERKRRRLAQTTTYGIVCPKKGLLRTLQYDGAIYKECNLPPIINLPAKLERLLTTPKRFKVVFGGRGGGKSQTFGDIFISRAKDQGEKTACFRELQNSIEDSVHSLLVDEIERVGFEGFTSSKTAIEFAGSDAFKYKGLSRNPDAVKSLHGFKYAWVEEAQAVSNESLRTLTPTFREKGAEMWFSLNPGSTEDPISKRFLTPFMPKLDKNGIYEDDLHLIIRLNYSDNPWFPAELEQERAFDKASLPGSLYRWVWDGEFNDSVENALIRPEWFDACIDAHIKLNIQPAGAIIAAHDPSDTGADSKGLAIRHGSVILDVSEKTAGDIADGCDWAISEAIRHNADVFAWDGDGMGVALNRQIDGAFAGKNIQLAMFRGSHSPDRPDDTYQPAQKSKITDQKTNRQVFRNQRAQYYAELQSRVFATFLAVTTGKWTDPEKMISFSSDIDNIAKLRAELCRLPVKPNTNGLFQLYTKDEMRSRFKIPSPNMGDAVMMCMRMPHTAATAPLSAPIQSQDFDIFSTEINNNAF